MIYGLIISAGKQKRFGDKIPKALARINGISFLDINLNNLRVYCDKVYVVCSYENEIYFVDYPHITIESGFGCGDAVLKALGKLPLKTNDKVFIQWGDSIQEYKIYRDLSLNYNSGIIVPCQIEKKPYVQLIANSKKRVLFSKYNEKTSMGLHDLSLFYGNANEIIKALEKTARKISKKGIYKNNHGNEFNFLDIFNETNIRMDLFVVQNYKGFSFNTKKELKEKINELEN